MESAEIVSWTRLLVLLLALGIAAIMDLKDRRVPNEFWITWAKPAIFLWTLDLLILGVEWYTIATAAGMVAYASTAVIGRPTISDILSGKSLDILVSIWYMIGIIGVVQGLILHSDEMLPVVSGNSHESAEIWWKTFAVFIPIFLVDTAWRLRLIHGGADCKALMWVSILVPYWASIPVLYPQSGIVLSMPPAIALLVWGGFAFLVMPFIMVVVNLKRGEFNLRLIWHAEKMDITKVLNSHVWLLTTTASMPDGEIRIVHRTRAPSQTPTVTQLESEIKELVDCGVEHVWVTRKYPLLVFLWPAIFPLFLFGGPMSYILSTIGI